MILKSIRFKIILWHMLILSLAYLIFSLVLFHMVNRRLQNDLNDLLFTKAEGIQDSVESYWQTEKEGVAGEGIRGQTLSKRNNPNFEKIVRRWLQEKTDDPILLNIDVQIFDSTGGLIGSSGKLAGVMPEPAELLRGDKQDQSRLEDRTSEISPGKLLKYRILSSPQMENGQVAYFVQVFSPLSSLESSLRQLKLILFLLFPFFILMSGVIGTFLAGVSLNPISRMMDTIQRITAENLRLRVTVPDSQDELKRLANTFNGMLDRLEKSFTSQQQFIEDMAHELKTPLAVIKGELEVTLKKMRSAQDYESILRSSLEEVNRIIAISENLLLLARYENDRIALEKIPLDLDELVREITDHLTEEAGQKNIALRVSLPDRVTVSGDRTRLHHLLLNILDNALKYTPAGGTIVVQVRRDQGWAKTEIRDTGPGIPETELPHIFDRFFRGEQGRQQGSFGLGLSIAKSIAEAHQGKIEADSCLNRGTTFTVSLPLAEH